MATCPAAARIERRAPITITVEPQCTIVSLFVGTDFGFAWISPADPSIHARRRPSTLSNTDSLVWSVGRMVVFAVCFERDCFSMNRSDSGGAEGAKQRRIEVRENL